MHSTKNIGAFLFATRSLSVCFSPPASVLNLIAPRMVHLRLIRVLFWLLSRDHHIWCSLVQGLPWLVLLGIVPTVLGQNFEKYKNSKKLSGWTPTAKIITRLLACRQLTPKNTEKQWHSALIYQNLKILRLLISSQKLCFPSILGLLSYPGEKAAIQRNLEFSNIWKRVS